MLDISTPPVQITSKLEGGFSYAVCTSLFFLVAIRALGAWKSYDGTQKVLFPAFLVDLTRCGHRFSRLSRGGGVGGPTTPLSHTHGSSGESPTIQRGDATTQQFNTGQLVFNCLCWGVSYRARGLLQNNNNTSKYRKPLSR